jgi:hypothetical protein
MGCHFMRCVLGGMSLGIGLVEICYAFLLWEFQEGNDVVAFMIVLMASRCK